MLEGLGDWTWEPFDDQWEEFVEELRKHYAATGTTRVPPKYKTPDGYSLGARVSNQRIKHKKGKLSAERIKTLEGIGNWTWDLWADQWQEFFDRLQKHFETTGTPNVVYNYKTPDGYPLGARITKQRTAYKLDKLSAERIEMLESLDGWTWEPLDDQWQEFVSRLQAHYETHGATRMLSTYKTPDGYLLGKRVLNQRVFYKNGKLSAERIEFLESFDDWTWERIHDQWQEFFDRLRRHFETTGTTRVSENYKTPDGYLLGNWRSRQRGLYKKGELSAERIELLESLGDWSWEPQNDQWQEFFNRLREHYETTGTVRVPASYETPDGYPLGRRVGRQRVFYNRDELSAERIELLEGLGDWSWNPFSDKWQKFVEELQRHLETTGTTRAKATYKTPDGYPLGRCISRQRTLYREGKLSADRIAILENIGDWTWDARN